MQQDLGESIHPRVATIEITHVTCLESFPGKFYCQFAVRAKDGSQVQLQGSGDSLTQSIAAAVSDLCVKPIAICWFASTAHASGQRQNTVAVCIARQPDTELAVGRATADSAEVSLVVATLRAVSHAGLLKSVYRANHQKILRIWSAELVDELLQTLGQSAAPNLKRLEAEGIVLESMNRVASAAVLTATNHPKPNSILSLFDTSAWLFDHQGRRRDSYTDTELWLAWYPGIANDHLICAEVIKSMPAAPEAKIPWIVRLFENPESRWRFRGAVDLQDHDMLHVLLGRGLQDQDEAFVLGFAMGTAKRISWIEYWIFKFVLAWLYPEPYRVPKFLQPAFELGVQCGQATGVKNLYQRQLKELSGLTLGEARSQLGIDMALVRKFYELEQQQIPVTIASLRLP